MTDELIRDVLQLQGTMHPHQVISLEDLPGETSFALPDHYDHVHVGYHPIGNGNPLDSPFSPLLKPDQWQRLIERLGQIENPEVPIKPSTYSLPDREAEPAREPTPATAKTRAGAYRENPGPGHSYSDSRSSTSPARCPSPTAATWPAATAASGESVLVVQTLGAPPPPAPATAPRRGAAEPGAEPAGRCRSPGPPRSAPSRRSTTRAPPPLARGGERGRGHHRRPRSPTAIALLNRALHAQAVAAADPHVRQLSARARGGGPARLRQRRAGRRRPLRRRPRGRRPGQRRLAAAAAPGGPAAPGTGRRGAGRARAARRLRDPAAARPRRPRRRPRRARRRCSCGSASRRCWSSCGERWRTPATRRTWRC